MPRSSANVTIRKPGSAAKPARPAARPAGPSADRFDVHPGVKMMQDWIATLRQKTGRSLEEWLKLARKSCRDETTARTWLKNEHKLGTNSAWWIAERAFKPDEQFDDDPQKYLRLAAGYVQDMYAGPKAALKPIHDELIRLARGLGDDVQVCPCKTIVPLYRKHVFAQIKPATRTRIDFGLALGDTKAQGRLIDTGGFARKDRITHKFELTSPEQIDAEVKRWLKIAYTRDAT